MRSKKLCVMILVVLVAAVCGIAISSVLPVTTSASEYMEMSDDARVMYAQKQYKTILANSQSQEILVTFNEATVKEILQILPSDTQTVSVFHYFHADGETVNGAYTNCANKTVEQILKDYFNVIYNMVVGQLESYDASGKDTDSQNYRMLLRQKEAMENGQFCISGIRIVATAEQVKTILNNEKVFLVEALNFDNNNIISPLIVVNEEIV